MTHTSISLRSSWRVLGVTLECHASIRENELIFLGGALGLDYDPWRVTLDSSFLDLQGEMSFQQKPDVSRLILADRLAAYICSLSFSSLAGANIEEGGKGGKLREYVCWHGPLIPRGRGQKGKSIQTSRPEDNMVVNESQASHVQAHFCHRHGLEQFLERIL